MAKDKRRMEQNRAKKRASRSRTKKRQAPSGRIAAMGCTRGEIGRSPVHAAYIADTFSKQGIGHVIIARAIPDGRIVAGVFLVDVYCLGVKNAFMMVQSPSDFENAIEQQFSINDLKPATPACARKLIDDAIAYARDLGFEPHRDFRDASVVLGDIDPAECDQSYTFGKDGKPLYIAGPHDSDAMIHRVMTQLRNRGGPDGSHFMIPLNDPSEEEALGLDGKIVNEDGEEME